MARPQRHDLPEDKEALERWLFVMPHRSAVVDGEEYDRLDPADPDERSLLIKGEHPDLQEYLTDASWDGEIDGMNPRSTSRCTR